MDSVFAPFDTDPVVRRPTPAEAALPPAMERLAVRFHVGDRVAANMGPQYGFVRGKVVKCKPVVTQGGPRHVTEPNAKNAPPPDGQSVVAAYEIFLEKACDNAAGPQRRIAIAPADDDRVVKRLRG